MACEDAEGFSSCEWFFRKIKSVEILSFLIFLFLYVGVVFCVYVSVEICANTLCCVLVLYAGYAVTIKGWVQGAQVQRSLVFCLMRQDSNHFIY